MDKDRHETHLYIPRRLYIKLKALAGINRRTVNAETLIAIEKHVEPEKGKRNETQR